MAHLKAVSIVTRILIVFFPIYFQIIVQNLIELNELTFELFISWGFIHSC